VKLIDSVTKGSNLVQAAENLLQGGFSLRAEARSLFMRSISRRIEAASRSR
jgi:hypothetical protein